MIRHVVLMRFSDPADATEAQERLEALDPQIDEVRSLDVGVDVLRGEFSWDLALVTTHDDLEALHGYQAHPAHAEFGGWVRPRLRDRATVDMEL